MAENIKLGGSIELVGFNDLSVAESIVAKKIIGGFARGFSDESDGYEKLVIERERGKLEGILTISGEDIKVSDDSDNLFIALGKVLNKLEKEAKK